MLTNFQCETRTQFYGTDGKRVEAGPWSPTYFKYVRVGIKEWLVVSDRPDVEAWGKILWLTKVTCPIKGMEELAGPCTARKHYKTRINVEDSHAY